MTKRQYLKEQAHYRRVWKLGLTNLLGWDESRIAKWSKPFLDKMLGPNLITHRAPVHYVACAVVTGNPNLNSSIGPKLVRTIRAIELALNQGGDGVRFPRDYDWAGAKRRISRIITKAKGDNPL